MDNPQETKSFKIGWLIGAIEGEGTITINWAGGKASDKTWSNCHKPNIRIYNGDQVFIDRAIKYLTDLNIPFHVRSYRAISRAYNKEYKPILSIEIQGMKRCLRTLEVLRKYFQSKKPQAEVLWSYVNSRLNRPIGDRKNTLQKRSMTRAQYQEAVMHNDYEMDLINQIRELNRRGKGARILTDYTRSATNEVVKI